MSESNIDTEASIRELIQMADNNSTMAWALEAAHGAGYPQAVISELESADPSELFLQSKLATQSQGEGANPGRMVEQERDGNVAPIRPGDSAFSSNNEPASLVGDESSVAAAHTDAHEEPSFSVNTGFMGTEDFGEYDELATLAEAQTDPAESLEASLALAAEAAGASETSANGSPNQTGEQDLKALYELRRDTYDDDKIVRRFMQGLYDTYISKGIAEISTESFSQFFSGYDIDEGHMLHGIRDYYESIESNNPGQRIPVSEILSYENTYKAKVYGYKLPDRASSNPQPQRSVQGSGGGNGAAPQKQSPMSESYEKINEDKSSEKSSPQQVIQDTNLGSAALAGTGSAIAAGVGGAANLASEAMGHGAQFVHRMFDGIGAVPDLGKRAVTSISSARDARERKMMARQDVMAGEQGIRGLADAIDNLNSAYSGLGNARGPKTAKQVKLRDSLQKALQSANSFKKPGMFSSMPKALKTAARHQFERLEHLVEQLNQDERVYGNPKLPQRNALRDLIDKVKEIVATILEALRPGRGREGVAAAAPGR